MNTLTRVMGLLLATLPLIEPLDAANAEPFGVHLAFANTDIKPVKPEPSAEALRELESATARLEDLRNALGPYHPDLVAPQTELSRMAEELGRYDAATSLSGAALHNLRVNQGLDTADQVPILEGLLHLARLQGDAGEVGAKMDYYHRMMGFGHPPWSEESLSVTRRWLGVRSELVAKNHPLGPKLLLDAMLLGERVREGVCNEANWSTKWCKPITLDYVSMLFLLDYQIEPLVVDSRAKQREGINVRTTNRMRDVDVIESRLIDLKRSMPVKGKRLLEEALLAAPEDVDLKLALADWSWFRGKRSRAREAWAELAASNPDRFASPEPLPAVSGIERDPRLVVGTGVVEVVARIDTRGRASDIRVRDPFNVAGDQERDLIAYATRHLRAVLFRPALSNQGEPVPSEFRGILQVFP